MELVIIFACLSLVFIVIIICAIMPMLSPLLDIMSLRKHELNMEKEKTKKRKIEALEKGFKDEMIPYRDYIEEMRRIK